MTTDRELLEGAARAAGYKLWFGITDSMIECNEPEHPQKTHNIWNPLADDGDALRLAVKLGMTIAPFPVGARVRFQNYILDTCEVEVSGNDPYAATRRAIVRAAYEIGKAT